jgi:hypothetical protein
MMSETVTSPSSVPVTEVTEWREPIKLSWGALLGGFIVALGVWLLLNVLGLAIGLSAIDPNDAPSLRAAGISTGVWTLIVPVIALFVGGIVAARTAGIVDRTTGAIHGAVVWSLASIAMVLLVGTLARGVIATTGGVLSAAGVAGGEMGQTVAPALGLDTNDLVAPLNERLRAEGRPQVSPRELQNVVRDAMSTSVREGRFDKEVFVRSLTENTNLSFADARSVADRVQAQVETQGRNVQHGALTALDKTGKAMWWVFLGMLVSLFSALVGAMIGVTRHQRERAITPSLATHREVHT